PPVVGLQQGHQCYGQLLRTRWSHQQTGFPVVQDVSALSHSGGDDWKTGRTVLDEGQRKTLARRAQYSDITRRQNRGHVLSLTEEGNVGLEIQPRDLPSDHVH